MLARILRIKGCVASALLNFEKTDIEFTSKDFELMRKVTMILRFFHKATQMLSEDDCSVLCPCQSPLFFINFLLSYSL